MNRIIRRTTAKKRRKKIIKYTKGCFGSHSKLFTISNQQFMKAKSDSFSDRRKKKRNYKCLWITRINSISKEFGLKYKKTINQLKIRKINLNKKILSSLYKIDQKLLNIIINVKYKRN